MGTVLAHLVNKQRRIPSTWPAEAMLPAEGHHHAGTSSAGVGGGQRGRRLASPFPATIHSAWESARPPRDVRDSTLLTASTNSGGQTRGSGGEPDPPPSQSQYSPAGHQVNWRGLSFWMTLFIQGQHVFLKGRRKINPLRDGATWRFWVRPTSCVNGWRHVETKLRTPKPCSWCR